MTGLSICIMASVREKAVKRLLQSISLNVDMSYELIVVNNSDPYTQRPKNRPDNLSLDTTKNNVSWHNIERPVSIAEQRHIALDKAEGRYVWLLDDDLVVMPKTAFSLYSKLAGRKEIDIISCLWRDFSSHRPNDYRPVGWSMHEARQDGELISYKNRMHYNELHDDTMELLRLDGVQGGSVMIDTHVVDDVSWDGEYNHYWEIEDYFMQCLENNISVWCDLSSCVLHDPIEYPSNTLRQEYDPELDKQRFEDKWSTRVIK